MSRHIDLIGLGFVLLDAFPISILISCVCGDAETDKFLLRYFCPLSPFPWSDVHCELKSLFVSACVQGYCVWAWYFHTENLSSKFWSQWLRSVSHGRKMRCVTAVLVSVGVRLRRLLSHFSPRILTSSTLNSITAGWSLTCEIFYQTNYQRKTDLPALWATSIQLSAFKASVT